MKSITENEARTIEFLVRNFDKDYNINQLGKELRLSPGGIFKILKKLRNNNILIEKKIGNNLIYKINFKSEDSIDVCKFALAEKEVKPYIKVWIKDLSVLKEKTDLAILFGSILTKGKEARDIDILLVFKKENFKIIDNLIEDINRIKSRKIHPIMQTQQDFIKNVKNKDKIIIEGIRTGLILWGKDLLIEAIKNGQD